MPCCSYFKRRWRLLMLAALQDDTFYVHYFIPKTPEHFRLHGKALTPDRFSRFHEPPDPRLVAWHYNQAVKARIRGFSVGMGISETA